MTHSEKNLLQKMKWAEKFENSYYHGSTESLSKFHSGYTVPKTRLHFIWGLAALKMMQERQIL